MTKNEVKIGSEIDEIADAKKEGYLVVFSLAVGSFFPHFPKGQTLKIKQKQWRVEQKCTCPGNVMDTRSIQKL